MSNLEQLIDAYLDDDLTPDQGRQLEDALLNDADFLQLFLAKTCEHRLLYVALAGQASMTEEADETVDSAVGLRPTTTEAAEFGDSRRRPLNQLAGKIDWGRHPLYFAATVAVLTLTAWLVFGTFLKSFWPGDVQVVRQDGAGRNEHFIARLAAVNGARWQGDAPRSPILAAGRKLQLTNGLAQIEFASGASVILEAPVTFVVQDDNSGRLTLGKAAVHVPRSAVGFTIDTPSAYIVDLGTEFGVEVAEDGGELVDVMLGSVELFLRGPDGTPHGQSTVLSGGKAVRVVTSEDGGFRAVPAGVDAKPQFARVMPAGSLVQGDVLTMRIAAADARMTAGAIGANHGSGTLLSVHSVAKNVQRSVLKFDIADLPANAQIKSAELVLFASRVDNRSGSEMEVYRLVSPWSERHVSWRKRLAKASWPVPGGDGVGRSNRLQTDPYASSMDNPPIGAAVRWDVTDLVRQWQLGKYANHGLLLLSRGENRLSFWSREAPDPNLRPRLVIRYERAPPQGQPPPHAEASVDPADIGQ